jgi:hypothetical protein
MQLQPIKQALLPFGSGARVFLDGTTFNRSRQSGRYTYRFDAATGTSVKSIQNGTVVAIGNDAQGDYVLVKVELSPGIYAYDKYSGLTNPYAYSVIGEVVQTGDQLGNHGDTLTVERYSTYYPLTGLVDTRSSLLIDFQEINEDAIGNDISSYNSSNFLDGATKNDITWINRNGALNYWDNGRLSGGGNVAWLSPGQEVLGKGELYGNGLEQILVRNNFTNEVKIYDGGLQARGVTIGHYGQEWQFGAILSNDSGPDRIAWKHEPSNQVWTTDFNGKQITGGTYLGGYGDDWKIVATVDGDRNGIQGLAFEHTSGLLAQWEDAKQSKLSITGVNSNSQDIVASGDFNGDNQDDTIRFDRNTREYQILKGGSQYDSYFGGILGQGEVVLGASDINNDGRSDLITRDGNNNVFANFSGQQSGREFLANVPGEWDMVNSVN